MNSQETAPPGTFTVEHHVDREEWLHARNSIIGGSEAAALWGLSHYDSPYSLWAKKRGLLPDDDNTSEAMEIGTLTEPVVAELYSRRTNRQLVYLGAHTMLRSTVHPFMAVTVDRVILDNLRGPGVLETKNRGVGAVKNWREELPGDVQAQVQHALAVTGYGWGAGAGILGGNKFLYADLDALPDFIGEHVRKCQEMHRRIEQNDPPPIDGHDATTAALAQVHAKTAEGKIVRLPAEADEWTRTIEDCKRDGKVIEMREKEAKNKIRAAIGDAEAGILGDGISSWTLQLVQRKGYEVKPTEYRQLVRRGK